MLGFFFCLGVFFKMTQESNEGTPTGQNWGNSHNEINKGELDNNKG